MSAVIASMITAPVVLIFGHYGVGKTNFALNVAIDAAKAGIDVTMVDLDIVNPYFRSTEYRGSLEAHGVKVVAPVFAEAGTSLDVPSLTGAVIPAIQAAQAEHVPDQAIRKLTLIDCGGDDAGATALGRFVPTLKMGEYQAWYVVNAYRNLTQSADEALEVLHEIERKSTLACTGIVSNSHMKDETSAELIAESLSFARETAALAGLPLMCVTAPNWLVEQEKVEAFGLTEDEILYPVLMHVKAPWEL